MKTQNNKLIFKKGSIVELNSDSLIDINGGSSPICIAVTVAVTISIYHTYDETGTREMVEDIIE